MQDCIRRVEEYFRLNPSWRDQRRVSFFLDEIQVVAGWEIFVRRLLDTEQIEIFLQIEIANRHAGQTFVFETEVEQPFPLFPTPEPVAG